MTRGVSPDTARLTLPLDTSLLWQLPQQAAYTASSGRAHLSARMAQGKDGQPPALVIEANCDSLQQLCLLYEQENRQVNALNRQMQNALQTASGQRPDGVRKRTVQAGALLAVLLVMALAAMLYALRKLEMKKQ